MAITKFHPNGEKKKEILDIIKNGNDFKLIIGYDQEGKIFSLMEKPCEQNKENVSGAHILPACPENNHIDWFNPNSKEYSKNIRTYGYDISENIIENMPKYTFLN